MEGECKVQLDATVEAEAGKQTTQKFGSRLTTALLTLTLCLAAALAAAAIIGSTRQAKVERQEEDNADIHRTLRQMPERKNTRAAIHLRGHYNPEKITSVEWENQVDQSYSQGGLELVDNEIVIPTDGLYFIYSQASFSVNCSSNDGSDPMVHLSHTVQRSSNTYGHIYETILHSVRTACQRTDSNNPDEDGNWFSTIYMGAVFKLNNGDKLKTVMEERMLKNLESDAGKTFFGVFAL